MNNIIEKKFYELISEELKVENISKETELESLGLDSITYIKLIVAMEKTFEIEFDDDDLNMYNFKTVSDLLNKIEKMCR
ncbi:acyl carrier protein [Blautia pseudococcoides]|nr:acyl carrier protein [Blautia pseudococcoides]